MASEQLLQAAVAFWFGTVCTVTFDCRGQRSPEAPSRVLASSTASTSMQFAFARDIMHPADVRSSGTAGRTRAPAGRPPDSRTAGSPAPLAAAARTWLQISSTLPIETLSPCGTEISMMERCSALAATRSSATKMLVAFRKLTHPSTTWPWISRSSMRMKTTMRAIFSPSASGSRSRRSSEPPPARVSPVRPVVFHRDGWRT